MASGCTIASGQGADFFFQARASFGNEPPLEINSDETWYVNSQHGWASDSELRTGSGEGRPNLIGFVERFDGRKMMGNWRSDYLPGEGWRPALSLGVPPVAPWSHFVLVKRPPLFRERVSPARHWIKNGFVIYDFGQELTGSPELTFFSVKGGVNITIGTAERLFADSTADFKRRVNYADYYITKQGEQEWSPVTWRGFRYLAVSVNDSVQIKKVASLNRHYAVSDAGSFECSDKLLNRIWNTGRFTLKLCSQDTYMDTPWREQTQYIAGDSRYLMKYALYASGPSSEFLTRYNILSGAWSQRWMDDGSIRSRYPTDWLIGEGTSGYLIDYELEWVIMLREYYMLFGNKDLLRQVYPNLQKLMGKFETLVSKETGVMANVPGWIVLDHPDTYPMDLGKEITALNCLYYGALKTAAFLAGEIMGFAAEKDRWEAQADRLKQNIITRFWDHEKGLFSDSHGSKVYSQQTQVYALLYDLVEDKKKAALMDTIISKGRSSEMSFAYYVVYSVFEKHPQWALDYIRKNWGDQLKLSSFNGGWQEGWNVEEWTGDFGSTSHAWCSGPTALLPQKVLGIEPLAAGFREFMVNPHSGNLKWAGGTVPTPAGDIRVSWTNNSRRTRLKITVPAGSKAFISLAGKSDRIDNKKITDYTSVLNNENGESYKGIWLNAGKHRVKMTH